MTAESREGLARMHALIDRMPRHLARSGELPGLRETLAGLGAAPGRIVLCGMGGSAIAGDLAAPLLSGGATSLTVWREYGLPAWTTAEDLVVVSSYSGNTEEALSGAEAALARGCPVIALTSGGQLGSLARDNGLPSVTLDGGLPPRASLGLGLGALVRILGGLGLVPGAERGLAAAASFLEGSASARGSASAGPDPEGNPACCDVAAGLAGRLPVIFTAGIEAHPVGLRWQAQLNENAKVPALWAPFPELDHNALVGWSLGPESAGNQTLLVVSCGRLEPRLERRVEITLDLLAAEFAGVARISSTQAEPLARILSLVQYGDYLSCHLAGLRGVDPVPVTRIEQLKQALADRDPRST